MDSKVKVVVRYLKGGTLKGYLSDASFDTATLHLEEAETFRHHVISLKDLKAVFFVRTFEGAPEYKEIKSYGARKPEGKRVFIKFRDGECMVGFLEGAVPWQKGFFLYRSEGNPGFYIIPADEGSNNIKTYVITDSVDDVTVVPCGT